MICKTVDTFADKVGSALVRAARNTISLTSLIAMSGIWKAHVWRLQQHGWLTPQDVEITSLRAWMYSQVDLQIFDMDRGLQDLFK